MLAGCYPWPDVEHDPLPGTDPQITQTTVSCDVNAARWSIKVTTDAWTGLGRLYLSADGDYVEQHTLPSVSAPSDGSSDTLSRELAIVASWRDVDPDSSTAFGCATPELTGVILVYSRTGSTRTDCTAFGDAPQRWASWNTDLACDTTLDTGGADSDSG